jgi:hypothetical protein
VRGWWYVLLVLAELQPEKIVINKNGIIKIKNERANEYCFSILILSFFKNACISGLISFSPNPT